MLYKRRKVKAQETRNVMKVRGLNVKFDGISINTTYGDTLDTHHYIFTHTLKNIDDPLSLLAPLLHYETPTRLTSRTSIDKSDINLEARCWLNFMFRNIFPSQDNLILMHPREVLLAQL